VTHAAFISSGKAIYICIKCIGHFLSVLWHCCCHLACKKRWWADGGD